MKIIISGLAILVILMALTPSAFALTDYQSGFQHGVSDGKDGCRHPDGCHWYILQPGKGFYFHTRDFIRGYVTGFCSIPDNKRFGTNAEEASWGCQQGPDSASWLVPGPTKTYDADGKIVPVHTAGYKEGFAEGVRDGHAVWFHHAKIRGNPPFNQPGFDLGYIDGWRSTCKDNGLDTTPGGACDLSMDANTE